MANKILHLRSSTASNIPSAGSLDYGELAINYADKKLFIKDSGNNVVEVGQDMAACTTSIVPAVDQAIDLGSATKQWRDVYVGPGSLYVNGQKVLEEDSGTIVVSADNDQNVQLKSLGTGDIEMLPAGTGVIQLKGTISVLAGENITSSDGNPINFADGIDLNGNALTNVGSIDSLTVTGNLTVNGTTTTVNSSTLDVADVNITVANGSTNDATANGAGITFGGHSGAPILQYVSASDRLVAGNVAGIEATTFYGEATSAEYADLAEVYSAPGAIEPGTVVHFGGTHEVETCDLDHCQKVAGVVSTRPAHLMNAGADGVAVALQGRVPCKVTGPVSKGDMMVSAGNGAARAEANPKMGAVIGKALEDSTGDGVIEVVVGRL